MERLLDKSDRKATFDPTEEYLADLIRASEPVVVTPGRKQRVLNRVTLRQQTRRSATSRLLRPVLALGVLALAGATAAATIGRRAWIERHTDASVRPAAPLASPPPRRARSLSSSHHAVAAALEEGPRVAPEPIVPVRASRPTRHAPKVTARARVATSEDPSRVVDAIQALRNDHDPARASNLLAEYLARYPHGALAEEAVALSIEAAAARRSPSAAVFAERYLRQYPNGRFRHTAEQALEQRPR